MGTVIDGDSTLALPSEDRKKPPKPGSQAYIRHQKEERARKTAQLADSQALPFTYPTVTFCSGNGVLVLGFRTSADLTAALGRPHVFYEGGRLKGALKGVNFPVQGLQKWVASLDSEMATTEEQWVIDQIKELCLRKPGTDADNSLAELKTTSSSTEVTYICAYIRPDKSTLLHEWAHAQYHLSTAYRETCHSLYEELSEAVRKVVRNELEMRNYRPEVFVDEWQAYCVEGPGEFGKKCAKEMSVPHRILKDELGLPP
ncbi:hypothetical protein DFS34DRAFT_119272 [Phlyctochytrium arcticum]|nr:hypothetical protein DFS34DRAFT_119272 [Phlyctochytrium arcticum]